MMVQFGIWMFDEKIGLIGRPDNFPEIYLKSENFWDLLDTRQGRVWKWPIEFARIGWFTPKVADDFNKAFFYAHKFLKGFPPVDSPANMEIDTKTMHVQTEILSDYFPGPEDEPSVWKQG